MHVLKKFVFLSFCLVLVPTTYAAGETSAAATGEGKQNATEASADQALAARVETALRGDHALWNEVTLSGSVENTAQAKRAVQVARGVEGVKRVQDKLVRESKLDMPATHISPSPLMPRSKDIR